MRIDTDILDFFKEQEAGGRHYQRRINDALRDVISRKHTTLEQLITATIKKSLKGCMVVKT